MAITYPLNLLPGFPGWSTSFELAHRQEISRQANGRTRVKDLGAPLWSATYQSKVLSANVLDQWRARLDALEGGAQEFTAWSTSRCRPIAHPGSAALPAGVLDTIGSNGKSVRVDDLVGITLSVGDMIQIGANLHRVMEPAVAASGLTPLFEVRPHLWAGTVVGDAVSIVRPACRMTIVPGSISSSADPRTGRGSISFQAMESR